MFITCQAIAELAQVKIDTVYRWRQRGLLPPPARFMRGNRPVFNRVEVEDFLIATGRMSDDVLLLHALDDATV